MLQIDKIAERIFSTLKGYGFKIKIFNEEGNETTDPTKGRRFFIDEPNFMITIDDKDNTIEFNKGKDVDFEKSVELQRRLQKIANNFLVNSTMNVFGKAISPRDFSFRAKMATESTSSMSSLIEGLSKMSGSKKTSRQTLENVKIIVRHKVPVNDEVRGSRSRNINSIFLEVDGNRTKFPIVNLSGARAMAQHMAHGGEFTDVVGKYIIENTMRLSRLNEFCRYALSNKLVTEDTQDILSLVKEHIYSIKNELKKLTGVKTYETVSARIAEFSTNMLVNDKTSEIKDMFTVKRFDEKFNEVLPIINQLINEQDQYKKLIDEVANKPVKVSNLSFNNTPVFEFANKDMELGHKIVNLSLSIVENTELSAFVSSVGNKLCKKTAISEFEYAVVKRVLENIVVRDNNDTFDTELVESKKLDHFFNSFEFGLLLSNKPK